MSQFPTFAAGQRILGSALSQIPPNIAFKQSDQQVVSSTTLVNDNDLFVPVVSGTYIVDMWGMFTAIAGGDIKVAWTFPSSSLMFWSAGGTGTANFTDNDQSVISGGTTRGCRGNGATAQTFPSRGYLISGGGGFLQMQFAQNTSNATPTIMKQGAWLRVEQVA